MIKSVKGLISPSMNSVKSNRVISYGELSHGYDLRLGREFKITRCTKTNNAILDPKETNKSAFIETESEDFLLIPPHGFVMAKSIETVNVPANITALVTTKPEYIKCGLEVIQVVLEGVWEGKIDLGLKNNTDFPIKVYVLEGIARIIFIEGE